MTRRPPPPPAPPRRCPHRRGSSYLLVLAVSSIVLLMGLTGLQLAQIEAATTMQRHETAEARTLAAAAVEHALTMIAADANWRKSYTHGVPIPSVTLGNGTFSWWLLDEDEDLDDDDADAVRIVGTGSVGAGLQMLSVAYDPNANPLDVLRTAVHVSGAAGLPVGSTLTVSGGPVSTGGAFTNDGAIDGDVETAFLTGIGTVSGTVIEPAAPQSMPPQALFDSLAAEATTLPFQWWFEEPLLSATVNPWGPTNDRGLYHMVVPPGETLRVQVNRINATLLIDLEPAAKLRLTTPILMEPHDPDLPVLVVRGNNATVELNAVAGTISEAFVGANLNPPGSPHQGLSDTQIDDVYNAGIHGLVHVLGTDQLFVTVHLRLPVTGALIIDANVSRLDAFVTHDPALYTSPPAGYTTAGGGVEPLSWRREVLP